MTAISGGRASDERVKCLRIFADVNGETHMEDIDITLQPRRSAYDPKRIHDHCSAIAREAPAFTVGASALCQSVPPRAS
jgi:hypothetical protein